MNVGLKTQIWPANEAADGSGRALPRRRAAWSRSRPRPSMASAPMPPMPAAIARLYEAKGRPSFNPLIAHVGDIAACHANCPFRRDRDQARGSVLAGTADAGAAEDDGLHSGGSRDRGPRHHRGPGSRPPGRAGHPARLRQARWWRPRPICRAMSRRPRRRTCRATLRADRPDRRRRRGHGRGRIHHRRVLRGTRCCCGPAGCRAARSSACSAGRCVRPPEDADNETDQPLAPGMLASHYAPRTQVRLNAERVEAGRGAAGVWAQCKPAGRGGGDRGDEFVHARRSRGGRRQSFRLSSCARQQRARAPSRSCRCRITGSARRSTTGCAAPRWGDGHKQARKRKRLR